MTKIYLIRHAEAEGNLYRRAQGQYDSLITPRGELQIAALERRFEPIGVDAVYASDLFPRDKNRLRRVRAEKPSAYPRCAAEGGEDGGVGGSVLGRHRMALAG
jgi:bisphosphoglycerate-dependent phosphoglycerate mutase